MLLRCVGDGITVMDRAGHVIYANDRASAMLGIPAADLLSRTSEEVLATFELLDEAGRSLPLERLPSRVARTAPGSR